MSRPVIESFFDPQTSTVSYVVAEPDGPHCAIIDSVLEFDPKSGRTATASADRLIDFVRNKQLAVDWILETHAHADHLSAAPYLQRALGGKTAIGAHIVDVQRIFAGIFNLEPDFATDGSQFDRLFADGDRFRIGQLEVEVMHTPGHTPACLTYLIGGTAFVGDTLFMPDYGTARADFPGGDAAALYRSIQKVLALPANTKLYLCHDYLTPERAEHAWETSVGEQLAHNVHVRQGISESDFVAMREARDKTLDMPRLLLPAVQINIRAGQLPPAESNGTSYLKTPVNLL